MPMHKRARMLGAAAVIAGVPFAALAQSTDQTLPLTPDRPAATEPTKPTDPMTTPRTVDKQATRTEVNPLIGLAVFSSDGSKLGNVQRVSSEPDGKVKAIHIKTGGFLGFGGKIVAIPEGKFTKAGDNVQLGLTAEEVSKLPEVKEQS
jgi:sporulation protein YlmC with PRC-barrel domain